MNITTADFGYKFKDKITGFKGVMTGYVQYITGCNQVLLAPSCKKDGSFEASLWFDEQRLEKIKDKKQILIVKNDNVTGFCESAPIK